MTVFFQDVTGGSASSRASAPAAAITNDDEISLEDDDEGCGGEGVGPEAGHTGTGSLAAAANDDEIALDDDSDDPDERKSEESESKNVAGTSTDQGSHSESLPPNGGRVSAIVAGCNPKPEVDDVKSSSSDGTSTVASVPRRSALVLPAPSASAAELPNNSVTRGLSSRGSQPSSHERVEDSLLSPDNRGKNFYIIMLHVCVIASRCG